MARPRWYIARLHYAESEPKDFTEKRQPSDGEIAQADQISVHFPNTDEYRVIHGADSMRIVDDLIDKVVFVVSPLAGQSPSQPPPPTKPPPPPPRKQRKQRQRRKRRK